MISDIMRVKSKPTARVPERPINLDPANQPPRTTPEPAKQPPRTTPEPAKQILAETKYYLRPRVATVGRGMCFSFGKQDISRSFTATILYLSR